MMDRGKSEKRHAEGLHAQRKVDIVFADEEERTMFASDVAVAPSGIIAYPGTAHMASSASNSSPEEDRFHSGILLKPPLRHDDERFSKRLKLAFSTSSSTTPPASHNQHTRTPQPFANDNQIYLGNLRQGGNYINAVVGPSYQHDPSGCDPNIDNNSNAKEKPYYQTQSDSSGGTTSRSQQQVVTTLTGSDQQLTLLLMESHRARLLMERNQQLNELLVGLRNQTQPPSIVLAPPALGIIGGGGGGGGSHIEMMPEPADINRLVMGSRAGNQMSMTQQLQHQQGFCTNPQQHRLVGFGSVSRQQIMAMNFMQQQNQVFLGAEDGSSASNTNLGNPGSVSSYQAAGLFVQHNGNPRLNGGSSAAAGRHDINFNYGERGISSVQVGSSSTAAGGGGGDAGRTSFPARGINNHAGATGLLLTHQHFYAREKQQEREGGVANPLLYASSDDRVLSEYQCLIRKQIEVFEVGPDELGSNARGRNKPIVAGQVGIRCRHCSSIPSRHRTRGASYYPSQLRGIYQAAQNMASTHLSERCPLIPDELRQELIGLHYHKSSTGGGKQYWTDSAAALGIIEMEGTIRFTIPKYHD